MLSMFTVTTKLNRPPVNKAPELPRTRNLPVVEKVSELSSFIQKTTESLTHILKLFSLNKSLPNERQLQDNKNTESSLLFSFNTKNEAVLGSVDPSQRNSQSIIELSVDKNIFFELMFLKNYLSSSLSESVEVSLKDVLLIGSETDCRAAFLVLQLFETDYLDMHEELTVEMIQMSLNLLALSASQLQEFDYDQKKAIELFLLMKCQQLLLEVLKVYDKEFFGEASQRSMDSPISLFMRAISIATYDEGQNKDLENLRNEVALLSHPSQFFSNLDYRSKFSNFINNLNKIKDLRELEFSSLLELINYILVIFESQGVFPICKPLEEEYKSTLERSFGASLDASLLGFVDQFDVMNYFEKSKKIRAAGASLMSQLPETFLLEEKKDMRQWLQLLPCPEAPSPFRNLSSEFRQLERRWQDISSFFNMGDKNGTCVLFNYSEEPLLNRFAMKEDKLPENISLWKKKLPLGVSLFCYKQSVVSNNFLIEIHWPVFELTPKVIATLLFFAKWWSTQTPIASNCEETKQFLFSEEGLGSALALAVSLYVHRSNNQIEFLSVVENNFNDLNFDIRSRFSWMTEEPRNLGHFIAYQMAALECLHHSQQYLARTLSQAPASEQRILSRFHQEMSEEYISFSYRQNLKKQVKRLKSIFPAESLPDYVRALLVQHHLIQTLILSDLFLPRRFDFLRLNLEVDSHSELDQNQENIKGAHNFSIFSNDNESEKNQKQPLETKLLPFCTALNEYVLALDEQLSLPSLSRRSDVALLSWELYKLTDPAIWTQEIALEKVFICLAPFAKKPWAMDLKGILNRMIGLKNSIKEENMNIMNNKLNILGTTLN